MTKEELIKLSRENLRKSKQGSLCECYDEAFIKGYELSKKRIAELKEENAVLEKRIERAKECMRKLLFIINSDPANYNCKGLIQDAEDFIHNRTCNIRQHGEHCISETRCIMCDKEIEK